MASDVGSYTPQLWVPDAAPGISAAILQALEDQVEDITDEFNIHNGGVLLTDHPEVTPSVRGFMTAADKTKLNTVETNAAADQTDAQIYQAVQNEGAFGLVSLRKAGAIGISNNNAVNLFWDIEDRDDWSGHPTGQDEVNDDGAGIYLVNAVITWASNSSGYRQIALKIGTTIIGFDRKAGISGDTTVNTASALWRANGSQQFFLEVFQNSGGVLNVNSGATTRFQVAKLANT